MFRAYKIQESLVNSLELNNSAVSFLNRAIDDDEKKKVTQSLIQKLSEMIKKSSFNGTNHLEAESIWADWFPEINADIFISHSSKDIKIAQKLSSWLNEKFGIKSFIDSQIWGHSDELLKKIDNQYCMSDSGHTYSYEKRNGSTAHVHMMLSYALTRMIDKTECVIFIDSASSVTIEEATEGTFSPWIFHELSTIDTIQLNYPRKINKTASFPKKSLVEASNESPELKIKYPIWGKRLEQLDKEVLDRWVYKHNNQSLEHTLDLLYLISANKKTI